MKNKTARAASGAFLFYLLAVVFNPPSGRGQTTPSDSDKVFQFRGDVRFLATTSSFPEFPLIFPESQQYIRSMMRFSAQGRLTSKLQYDFHLVQHLDYFSDKENRIFNPETGKQRYQFSETPWEWIQSDRWTGGLFFDRLNIRISFPRADLTLGRQAVTFGKTYFWNPMDVFLPFRIWDIDRDYKKGVDAVRLDIPLGLFSGISLTAAPGKEIVLTDDLTASAAKKNVSWYGSALLAHFYTTSANWDLAFQA